jgi:FixJ family two-component response regulator
MSGYTEHAVMKTEAFRDGVKFLAKPFTSHDLIAKVREILGARVV